MCEISLSTQAGLKMILQCLPDSPFKDTATRIINEAIDTLNEQDRLIQEMNTTIENLQWNQLSEAEKDEAIRMAR